MEAFVDVTQIYVNTEFTNVVSSVKVITFVR